MTLSFDRPANGAGLRIRDAVERRQYTVGADRAIDPEQVPTDRFAFPVDEAVGVRVGELTLPTVVSVYVREPDGGMLAEAEHFASLDLSPAEYLVELCTPIKCYLLVDAPVSIDADATGMTLDFGGEREVVLGARSHHERPVATVTTTADPADVMAAVSTFGSALKTTTPERSYPTLRGHPPTVELGDKLDVPDDLQRPATGVRIELPRDLRSAYVAAPLSYYLGAEVVPGGGPRLLTEGGFVHDLDGSRGFEAEVERVLKQSFFLDCITRTEGLYEVDLHEREAVGADLSLDFADLYDRPLAEQLAAYLAVPYDAVEAHVPEWKLTTHVAPEPSNVEVLPFVVADLAVVRTPAATRTDASDVVQRAVDEFVRSTDASDGGRGPPERPSLVEPERTASLEQAWIGEEVPIGASKATVEAFRNDLAREPTDGDVAIAVVCNDPEMRDEHDAVGDAYDSREQLPFDVDLRRGLSVEELAAIFRSDVDFLHYVGHIDREGFECADGTLDARDLDEAGVDAFLLNACVSYEQGMALIEAGAIGGVVTLTEVIDSEAVGVGRTVARLLAHGFPLRASLNVAADQSLIGNQYLVVGDGNLDVAQPEGRTAVTLAVESGDGGYLVTPRSYPTGDAGMGTMTKFLTSGNTQYLNSGELGTFELTEAELATVLSVSERPVELDGDLVWGSDLLDDLDGS